MTEKDVVIAAFYHFAPLPEYEEWKAPLLDFCNERAMKGTILLASEGINGTMSGTREAIDALMARFRSDKRFADLQWKESYADYIPFERMKVRLKKEIVRMGVEDLDITKRGTYVASQDWDKLISDPEVIVVDTRNDYEVKIGQFKNAINPNTETFREFPKWVEENLDPKKMPKVAMYCTGGIRCEKSTALLKNMGFQDVYHLQGGILQYFEDTKNKNGMWEGQCFVFDGRVALDPELAPTGDLLCDECASPVTTDSVKRGPKDKLLCEPCLDKVKKQSTIATQS